jgi:sulfur-carrier protein
MATVRFAKAFRRHVACPDEAIEAATVGGALADYFERYPLVRSYVVDEHFSVRRHVALFVNDNQVIDRHSLTDPLTANDTVHVFQALSGG